MDELLESKKNNKNNKKKLKNRKYSKGVETLYRNAYRVQLDMIALAATKANIMISLNGFIVSILMVSGSFIFMNEPDFLIPIIVFLLTSSASIYFALTSASPEPPISRKSVLSCTKAFFTGKANWATIKEYRKTPKYSFDKDDSNILIFADYAQVSKQFYLECMDELIKDPDKLYQRMSDQLYSLGKLADIKFRYLRYSYSVFRWGLLLSIVVFLAIKAFHILYPHQSVALTNIVAQDEVKTFDKIYEPSGLQELGNGRLLVVEDESPNSLHILEIREDGSFKKNWYLTRELIQAFPNLDDLEAVTRGPDGYIYAITSHQRTSNGDRVAEREQFIRFKIESNKVTNTGVYTNLIDDIQKSGILGKVDEQGKGGIKNINIEALSFDQKGNLMIGFRAPLNGQKTIIGILENPSEIFTYNIKATISTKPLLLNLHGGGIRAMYYDETLKGYLISNEVYGIIGDNKHKISQILFWDGNATHNIINMIKPGIKNVEGITAIEFEGNRQILLSSDDGKKSQSKNASYLFLKYIEFSDKMVK